VIPRATYRLQFHKGFTFRQATPLAPYLARLGISHVYSSPITTARSGSTHGYDVVDPTRINPELGGEQDFRELVRALRAEGLGVILDIVPNHMAVGGGDNAWWLDVLENGEKSRHAAFFDVDWHPADPGLEEKVLAPFLGAPYAEILASGDLKLEREENGRVSVAYHHHRFPIRPEDRDEVLGAGAARYDGRSDEGRARLHDLLERQNFRLAWWRTAGDEINWRRFFDITELAGVRIERDEVFETIHALPLQLYAEGLIDGVRVDHVDGLADPAGYCRTLREKLDEAARRRPSDVPPGPAYFVIEKILAPNERLSPDWRTDGTTGYDFMNEVAALLHDERGAEPLGRFWAELSGRPAEFEEEERIARVEILTRNFAGQLDALVRAFHALARADIATRDITQGALRRALIAMLSVFPAYRTYGTGEDAPDSDAPLLEHAVREAKALAPGEEMVLERIAGWLAGQGPGTVEDRRRAVLRFQQLSAPVSAKAVEDTAFYRYGRLLSRNDVGFDPGRLASTVAHFHEANAERAKTFPHAMLTTATHDHKRGEDVRARLATLSELPELWIERARRFLAFNSGGDAIDPADAYMLFQMIVGAWPLGLASDDARGLAEYRDRLGGWFEKALREGKLRSSWNAPAGDYEERCRNFLARALDAQAAPDVLREAAGFVDEIAPAGALNSLVQALIRCTAPGVPDTYQGTEFWDFSLVDPDNRRPVDFDGRRAALDERSAPSDLLTGWRDGHIKQHVIARALGLREARTELFLDGGYEALDVRGKRAGDVLAFARVQGDAFAITVAPLRCAPALRGAQTPLPSRDWWADTTIVWRNAQGREMRDALGGEAVGAGESLSVADLLARFPVALLCDPASASAISDGRG
jgi:(1->4)-alpha-D-glucan 1-alpha-D-glucosylmutase